MKMLADIEELFNKSGCKAIDKKYHDYRMVKFMSKELTPEQKRIWKRYLGWRWRHSHPEFVSAQNKHYSEIYKKTKPFVITCQYCENQFNAARSSYHVCPNCMEKSHKKQLALKQAKIARRKAREHFIQEIIHLWQSGISQTEIARRYNRTQSGISALLRRHYLLRKPLANKK